MPGAKLLRPHCSPGFGSVKESLSAEIPLRERGQLPRFQVDGPDVHFYSDVLRIARVAVAGLPHHVTHHGTNRSDVVLDVIPSLIPSLEDSTLTRLESPAGCRSPAMARSFALCAELLQQRPNPLAAYFGTGSLDVGEPELARRFEETAPSRRHVQVEVEVEKEAGGN